MSSEDPALVLHETALLAANPLAPREARARVGTACAGWSAALADRAKLLASELVTNALNHCGGDIELRIFRGQCLLRVEVGDTCAKQLPALRHDLEAEHGRGLLIVSTLATSWGAGPGATPGTKTVWFELWGPGAVT